MKKLKRSHEPNYEGMIYLILAGGFSMSAFTVCAFLLSALIPHSGFSV